MKSTNLCVITLFVLFLNASAACMARADEGADERADAWFDRQADWNGFAQFHFKVAGRSAYLVAPKEPADGNPWVWRARFPTYHAEMDLLLLRSGFHVGYVDVAGMLGCPDAVTIGDAFYEFVTTQRKLSRRPALEGVSRGGLFVYNWTASNPDKVACIYCDTPVCDFKSWPGGKGGGIGSESTWRQCLKVYGFTEEQAVKYERNPIDHASTLAKAKIPILHIVSENDRVVPPKENTYLLKERLEKLGRNLEVISVAAGTAKSNGHHFDHPDPQRVVRFIKKHASSSAKERAALLRGARRIVFLGDSISYAGGYVAYFDAWLQTQKLPTKPVVINVGLPSETVSGLSEQGHAGGRFPRPDLAERLDRVLKATKPDLVFACYGINCGIYQPFSKERFHSYQQGVRKLKRKVEDGGAKLVLITPPFYDDQRAKKSFSYNAVLDRYSNWLISQREIGWHVADLHGSMGAEVAARRKTEPAFTFQPDAVHPNAAGHWFIASRLIDWFGDDAAASAKSPVDMLSDHDLSAETLKLVQQRMATRRDAYLTAAGHKRPGVRTGVSIEKAEQKAGQLTEKMDALAKPSP